MFLGQFHGHIDAQGRFPLPTELHPRLASGMVVTRGLDKCLLLFPRQVWQELASKVSGLPFTQSQARSLRRLLFSGALDCLADGEGCITLPAVLRSYAKIEKEYVLVGQGGHVEMWNPARWGEVLVCLEDKANSLAEELAI